MASAVTGVVVWEWQNEFGCWRPYDPTISTFIEGNKSSVNPLKLGHVDPSLYLYEIDLQKMCQVRLGTGESCLAKITVVSSVFKPRNTLRDLFLIK